MKHIQRALLLLGLALTCTILLSSNSLADEKEKNAALSAAKVWLSTIDNNEFEKCWSEASELIQKNVKKTDWASAISQAREPLGKVVTRAVKMTQYTTSLPGAPQGEYVVIQFQTSFKNRAGAIETVTMRREANKKDWAGAGYYIY